MKLTMFWEVFLVTSMVLVTTTVTASDNSPGFDLTTGMKINNTDTLRELDNTTGMEINNTDTSRVLDLTTGMEINNTETLRELDLATGMEINNTKISRVLDLTTGIENNNTESLRELDLATGMEIKNTKSLRMATEETVFGYWKKSAEQKSCRPTISCIRAGGSCIQVCAHCNGTTDLYGCRRRRTCKCCIPDKITQAPLATTPAPVTTAAASPTTTTTTTTTTAPLTTTKQISEGFEEFNGRIVRVTKSSDSRMTFQQSVERCTSMGSKPYIPHTREEFDFMVQVEKALSSRDIWFPVSDIQTEGQLKWTNGTGVSGSGITWCNGRRLYGNSNGNDCGMIYRDCPDTVQIMNCNYTPFPMICEL